METVVRVVSEISFGWPLVAVAPELHVEGVGCILTWRSLDRDTGAPKKGIHVNAPPVEIWTDENAIVAWLYSWVSDCLEHELAESFRWHGVRCFDPHVDHNG